MEEEKLTTPQKEGIVEEENKAKQQEYRYKPVGRPTLLSPEVVLKLEQAAAVDATIEQTCFFANIHRSTYFRWMNEMPELKDRLEDLRQRLPLKAKENIAKTIEGGDISLSKWLLERKDPDAYGETMKVDHTGSIDSASKEDKDAIAAFHSLLKGNIQKRSIDKAKQDGEI